MKPPSPEQSDLSPVYGFLKRPSLIDFPGRVSGVVFTTGCNFTCGFCHNAALMGASRPGLSWQKLQEGCRGFRRQWVEGIVVSGGEPTLLDHGLDHLLDFFRDFGFLLKLDTNGSRPDVVGRVLPKLAYVAMDIKYSLDNYARHTGFRQTEKVMETVNLLRHSPVDHEFRTTVIESIHDEKQIMDIAEMIRPARRYVIQAFIPRDDLPDENLRGLRRTSPDYMQHLRQKLEKSGCATEVVVK